jgi:cyclohexanone monooxygenase
MASSAIKILEELNGSNCNGLGRSSRTEQAIKEPIYTIKRKLRVVCVGAGVSGLFVAYKIQRHFDDFELNVFEKNAGVSGTWWENRYPGYE